MIDIRFYQAAAVVIPVLLLALGLMRVEPDPASGARQPVRGWDIARAVVGLAFVVVAELLALVSLAADESSVGTFTVVLTAVTLLLATLTATALRSLVEPLRGTWLEGVEWLVIVTTSVFAAAAISVALLHS